jgi:acetoacetate decarboxylase
MADPPAATEVQLGQAGPFVNAKAPASPHANRRTATGFDPASEAAQDAYSFPWDAPLVPRFPIRFRDTAILTVCYRTDPAAIDAILPQPLMRSGDTVMIHVARMGDVQYIGHANECNVMVGAVFDGESGRVEGGYSAWLFLDTDGGLAHGREVHGQPKKLARVHLEARGDLFVATVQRNGIEILTATLPYKARAASPDELTKRFNFVQNINYKVMPQIDGSPAIRQLTARRLEDVHISECWGGMCTVEIRPNAQAPLFRLPILEPLEGCYWLTEFTLVGGRVIHDYLRPGSAET